MSAQSSNSSAQAIVSVNSTTSGETKMSQLFAEFKSAVASVADTKVLKELAITVFNQVSSEANASDYDLLWLGVDCLTAKAFDFWVGNYSQVVAVSKAIAAFSSLGANIFPKQMFPIPDKVYVLGDFANYIQQKAVVKYCLDNNINLFGITELEIDMGDELGKVLIPAVTIEDLLVESSVEVVGGLEIANLIDSHGCTINNRANTAAILDAVSLCLTTEQLAQFVTSFGNFTHVETLKYQLHPAFSVLTYGHIEVDFETLSITTSREFSLRNNGYVLGYGEIIGQQLLALVLITITGSGDDFWGQSYLDAYLNSITAAEEEQDVYGDQMNESQQLRVIRANSVAILKAEADDLRYPYIQLRNNNNASGVNEVANYYMQKQVPFFVDKVAMKRVVVGAGVTALYAAMDFDKGILKTILDVAKPGKLFTRGWQTLCTPASQGIIALQEEAVKHVNSNLILQHHHRDGSIEYITIKGEAVDTITGDLNFIINGSGVGLGFKPFANSCKKTIPDSFNAMSLKEGETLEQVKAELSDALNKVLADRTVRKSGTHLLTFRGRPMLAYRGLNQEFVTCADWGASFSIRQLGTSKTLAIRFTVVYIYTDKEAKVRGLGEKTVLKDANKIKAFPAVITDSVGNKVNTKVLLGAECLKGNASRLQQYAEFCRIILQTKGGTPEDYKVALIGGHHPLAMEAVEAPELVQDEDLWTWTGNRTIQSLDDINSPFYLWWQANTQTYLLTDLMAVHDFLWLLLGRAELQQEWDGKNNINQDLLDAALSHPANKTVKLVNAVTGESTNNLKEASPLTGLVKVQEEFSGVRSLYVFQMELASIRECSNAGQSSTIQQIASVYAANPTLGEALADGIYTNKGGELGYKTIEQEDAILGLVAMSLNDVSMKAIGKEYKPASKLSTWALKDLATWNNSVFNTGANAIYPANKDPYLAFFDAGVGKKFKPSILVNRVGLTEVEAGTANFTFMQALEGSAQNYSINVGTGYNVASVSTCMAALSRHNLVQAMANKESNTTLKQLGEEIKLWGWVNTLAWKTAYENGWLASYNEKGATLSEMLHTYRKGYVMDGDKIIKSPQDVINEIKEVLCKIEGIPTTQLNDKWVSKFLWAFRIARGVSKVEKKENGWKKCTYDLALKEEDAKYVAICGAFRRVDQGKFAQDEELLTNDSEEGYGTSMWGFLADKWDEAKDLLPKWLSRKLWKAMQAHLAISETSKAIAYKLGHNHYQIDEDMFEGLLLDNDTNQVSVISSTDEFVLGKLGIPTIHFEYANQDAVDITLNIPQRIGGKLVLEPTSDLMSLQGAFVHYMLYCPIKPVENDLGEVANLVIDSDAPGGMHLNYGGSMCWLWKRSLTSKEVIQQAAIRYPNGAVISTTDEVQGVIPSIYIDFAAVLKTGAFTVSGAATGFALNLANFLFSMSKKAVENKKTRNESDFRKYGRNQIAGLQGQLREMLKAGTVKKIGKSAPTKQGSKVQTSHTVPYIHCEHGTIPVFMMNPHDEVIKEGGYHTGDFVSISRTPMIAKAYGVLVLSLDIAIGHLDTSGKVFALSNRGDGDGDPVDLSKEAGCISKEDIINFLGQDVISALSIKFW
jgi:hypothetical protein